MLVLRILKAMEDGQATGGCWEWEGSFRGARGTGPEQVFTTDGSFRTLSTPASCFTLGDDVVAASVQGGNSGRSRT